MSLFRSSISPLAYVGFAFVLDAAALSHELIWRLGSLLYAVANAALLIVATRSMPDLQDVRQTRLVWWLAAVIVIALQLVNSTLLAAFWPFLFGLTWQLGMALLFFVMLIRPIIGGDGV